MINLKKVVFSFGLILVFSVFGHAGSPDKPKSIFDTMGEDEVLRLTIEVDLDSIIAQRRKKEAITTSVSFPGSNGNLDKMDIKLAVRGKFRRVHCTVPPLKIDFKKKDLEERGLSEFDDYKLVTHCVSDPKLAKELIFKEYMAYKLYSSLTKFSYRVQLVEVTYRNPKTGKEDDQWGFLIEDTAELSARLGLKTEDHIRLPIDSLNQQGLMVVSLFQYMIRNADWGIHPSKNVKYFRSEEGLIPIPYDFDFSAFVGAPYAKTLESVDDVYVASGQYTDVRPEVFGDDLSGTLSYFRSKRKEMNTVIKKNKHVSGKIKGEMVFVLNRFFRNSVLLDMQ